MLIPVVEQTLAPFDQDHRPGTLRQLTLRFMGEASSGEDELRSDVTVVTETEQETAFAHSPLRAARALLSRTHRTLKIPPLAGYLSFDNRFAMHGGSSSNLAIAAVAYCALINSTGRREVVTLRSRVAITGDVDDDGAVHAVEESSIAAKLEAVFFSDAEVLALPRNQLTGAEQHLKRLQMRYPLRVLQLVGVATLGEVFFDRRLSDIRRVSVVKHGLRRAKRHWLPILLAFVVLGLSSYLLWKFGAPLDRNPTGVVLAGETLTLNNAIGQRVAQIAVTKQFVETSGSRGHAQFKLWALRDIDDDGVNEFFYGEWGPDAGENKVVCRSVSGDSIVWWRNLDKNLAFPLRPEIKGAVLRPAHVAVGDYDGDGRHEVLVNALHTGAPSVVYKLDAGTGEEISHYLHTGQFNDLATVDLNDDGVEEVILSGANNSLKSACLVVLDPRFVTGVSPHSPAYEPLGYSQALEVCYVRIPRTLLGEAFRDAAPYNIGSTLNVSRTKRIVTVMIVDDPGQGANARAYYFVRFDFGMRMLNASASDGYGELGEELLAKGSIARRPDPGYFEEYEKTIRYWTGSSWIARPTGNALYVEKLRERGLPH